MICLSETLSSVKNITDGFKNKERERDSERQGFKPQIDIRSQQSNNSWLFSHKIANVYSYGVLKNPVYFFPISLACFSPLPPASPVMNLNYGKVTFHSLDLSVALLELAVLPHYYGALIDRPIPLQTRLTKNVRELLAPL